MAKIIKSMKNLIEKGGEKGMRKHILMLAMLCLGLVLTTSSASAFDLGGYIGPIEMKFYDWSIGRQYTYNAGTNTWIPEVGRAGLPPAGSPAQDMVNGTYYPAGKGVEDNWGIFTVMSITDGTINRWTSGPGEEITGYMYGFDDAYINALSPTSIEVGQVGGFFDLYLDSSPDLTANPSPYLNPRPPGGGGGDAWNATDGSLFLSLQAVPGVVPPMPTLTRWETTNSLSVPWGGEGKIYFKVLGGLYAWMFDSNGYLGGTADLYCRFDFGPDDARLFDAKSSDPTYGTAVPEPTSLLLLGSGLLGLVALGRARRKVSV